MRSRRCHHPLNDDVVVINSVKVRDLLAGKEDATYGYFCREHRRMGRWKVTNSVFIPGEVVAMLHDLTPFDDI